MWKVFIQFCCLVTIIFAFILFVFYYDIDIINGYLFCLNRLLSDPSIVNNDDDDDEFRKEKLATSASAYGRTGAAAAAAQSTKVSIFEQAFFKSTKINNNASKQQMFNDLVRNQLCTQTKWIYIAKDKYYSNNKYAKNVNKDEIFVYLNTSASKEDKDKIFLKKKNKYFNSNFLVFYPFEFIFNNNDNENDQLYIEDFDIKRLLEKTIYVLRWFAKLLLEMNFEQVIFCIDQYSISEEIIKIFSSFNFFKNKFVVCYFNMFTETSIYLNNNNNNNHGNYNHGNYNHGKDVNGNVLEKNFNTNDDFIEFIRSCVNRFKTEVLHNSCLGSVFINTFCSKEKNMFFTWKKILYMIQLYFEKTQKVATVQKNKIFMVNVNESYNSSYDYFQSWNHEKNFVQSPQFPINLNVEFARKIKKYEKQNIILTLFTNNDFYILFDNFIHKKHELQKHLIIF